MTIQSAVSLGLGFSRRSARCLLIALVTLSLRGGEDVRMLFIGNSFTFGAGTKVHHYHPESVTDLNREGVGGVPALVKALTEEVGLSYSISLETAGGKGLDFHLTQKADVIGKPWDVVCMHGFSTLDEKHPGDPALLIDSAGKVAGLLHEQNARARMYLMATWARADQVYQEKGHWSGKGISAMTADVRRAYDQAAAACPLITGVIPVGEAWYRAIETGLADENPYDGLANGKIDLWGKDHYHASVHGYYLEALTIFSVVTGRDPTGLGSQERVAAELGITPDEARALQVVAKAQVIR